MVTSGATSPCDSPPSTRRMRSIPEELLISDQACAAAHQHDVLVAGELEVPQQHDRHEIAELQAGCGRIEAAVHRAALRAEVRRDFLRGVVDEPAPLELGEEVRHGAESYEMPPPLASAERPY